MLSTRYVTYEEDGLSVAHSLELDIIGVGETPLAAIRELKANIEAHLSFARFKGIDPFRSAPQKVQKLWRKANFAALGTSLPKAGVRKKPKTEAVADVMNWSKRQLSRLPEFDLQH